MSHARRPCAPLLIFLALSCGGEDERKSPNASSDAGADSGGSGAGGRGSTDASTLDVSSIDSSTPDAVTTDAVTTDTGASDGGTEACRLSVDPAVATHVTAMATNGWGAYNAAAAIPMYGCASSQPTRSCLSTKARANSTSYGAQWEADLSPSVLRILRVNANGSLFSARSSADGRFVLHGGGAGGFSTVIDLAADRLVGTPGQSDPVFTPDNFAWGIQPTTVGLTLCPQSVLTALPTAINLNEPGCSTISTIGLHEHLGKRIGGDYWSVDGQFTGDEGGKAVRTSDVGAPYTQGETIRLHRIVYTGSAFTVAGYFHEPLPYEGDAVVSPSALLLIGRVGASNRLQDGYRLHKLETRASADGGTTIRMPEIARYCFNGGTPAFSYDERWLVFHHYIGDADAVDLGFSGPSDPGFAPYRTQGAANVYLVDLTTGHKTRVTRMGPGQYALSPHFRSDGWMYFNVRVLGSSTEYIVASDAALALSGTPP